MISDKKILIRSKKFMWISSKTHCDLPLIVMVRIAGRFLMTTRETSEGAEIEVRSRGMPRILYVSSYAGTKLRVVFSLRKIY